MMRKPTETQAVICGEGAYRHITGCVRISPFRSGSVVQAHIRGLPSHPQMLGFSIEICGRLFPLPALLNACSEALMSVYTCDFTPCETVGACVRLTCDPCANSCPIACGVLAPCFTQGCCPPDPRPLFAAPIRR